MAKNREKLNKIEQEGYRAGFNGESKSSHLYFSREERMVFEQGYYRGCIEISRKRQAEKEAKRNAS